MIGTVFKNIGILLASFVCYAIVTICAGTIIGGDEHDAYVVGWFIGAVMFAFAMLIAYGGR
jgi:cbb3-type cytochrome oxidase subunit 1